MRKDLGVFFWTAVNILERRIRLDTLVDDPRESCSPLSPLAHDRCCSVHFECGMGFVVCVTLPNMVL